MFEKLVSSVYFRQYIVCIIATLSVFSFSLGNSWGSPVLVKLMDSNCSELVEPITDEQASWLASIGILVSIAVFLLVPLIMDRFGRKFTIILATFPRIISNMLLVFGAQYSDILLAKAVEGLSACFTMNAVPIYLAEVSSKEHRGHLGSLLTVAMTMGTLVMYSLGPFLTYTAINIMMLVVSIVILVPMLCLPESPFYYHSKGDSDKALKILTLLRGTETKALTELSETNQPNHNEGATIRQILKSPLILKCIAMAMIIAAGNQLCGVLSINFYMQTIMNMTKSRLSSNIASVIIGVVQLMATMCTIVTSDRYGRKPIIAFSLIGTAIGYIGLGTYFKFVEDSQEVEGLLNYLPLVSIVITMFSYGTGIGTLIWVIVSELFEHKTRAFGMSIATASNFVAGFIISKYFSAFTRSMGPANVFWLLSFNTIIYCVFMFCCVPETKGKSFEDIQKILAGKRTQDEVIKQ